MVRTGVVPAVSTGPIPTRTSWGRTFTPIVEPLDVEHWLHIMEQKFQLLNVTDKQKVTTSFQGTEDDEPKAHQIIQFGSFLFDAKKSKTKDAALSTIAHLLVKLIFEGDDFLMKTEKEAEKLY
jgi:hypothetical protein